MTTLQERINAISIGPQSTPDDLIRAERECRALARELPAEPGFKMMLGIILSARQNHSEAVATLESVRARFHTTLHFANAYAVSLMHLGQLDAAAAAMAAVPLAWRAPGGPDIPEAEWTFASLEAECALRRRDFTTAERLFLKIFDSVHAAWRGGGRGGPTPKVIDRQAPPKVHPLVYIPVEVKARELESRLLIAIYLAERGLTSLLGATWMLRHHGLADLPPGIALMKTLGRFDLLSLPPARARGHVLAALDEEAFGRSDSDAIVHLNVHPDAIAMTDLFLMQGEAHRAAHARIYPTVAKRMVVTGNPRTDLLSMTGSVDAARCAGGQILICLMSGTVNSAGRVFANVIDDSFKGCGADLATPAGAAAAAVMRDCVAYEMAMIRRLHELIPAIARRFPDRRIIVRPHPVESPELWRTLCKGLHNVEVHNEGPLSDWLGQAAVAVFLSGCASGVDACLAGVPAVRFENKGAGIDPDIGVSCRLGCPAGAVDGVLAEIAASLAGTTDAGAGRDLLASYLHLTPGQPASTRIADALTETWRAHRDPAPFDAGVLIGFNRRRKTPFAPNDFHLGKFPTTPAAEIQSRIDDLCRRFAISARPRLREADWNAFLIEPATPTLT